MKAWIAWVTAVFALLDPTSLAAETVALTAERDTTIFSRNNQASNALGILFTSTTSQGNIRRSLLAFDVAASIPAGSTITSASLTLTLAEAAADGMQLEHHLHRLLYEWGEGTSFSTSGNGAPATEGDATWTARLFPDAFWFAAGGDFSETPSASLLVGDSPGPYSWGSTPRMVADAQLWLDFPEENQGWIVLGNENTFGTARKFVNREDSDPAIRPLLTLEYTAPTTARFRVSKMFSDGREDPVEVVLSCNTGVPLDQSAYITGGSTGVNFVVSHIQAKDAECEITERDGPDGYRPIYNGGAACRWEGVTGQQYRCEILNSAEPATFTVTKEWLTVGTVAEYIDKQAALSIFCNNEISGGFYTGSEYRYDKVFTGASESLQLQVDTLARPAVCRAEENKAHSGIEVSSDCGPRTIPAGGNSACKITNTVFFEGIPTLGKYGLTLLVFVILGVAVFYLRPLV